MPHPTSMRLSDTTAKQLADLAEQYGNQTTALTVAIDRLWREAGSTRDRQIAHIAGLIQVQVMYVGWTLEEAKAQNAKGWTVDISNARYDGSWTRYEGVVLSDVDLLCAWTIANAPLER